MLVPRGFPAGCLALEHDLELLALLAAQADQLLNMVAVLPENTFGAQSIGRFDHASDEVRHGPREQLLVEPPLPHATHVLVAHDPDHAARDPDRCVEHGADAERTQVTFRETRGARILVRIVHGETALLGDGREVARHVPLQDDLPARVGVRCSLVQIPADQLVHRLEPPHAGALHIQELCRRAR